MEHVSNTVVIVDDAPLYRDMLEHIVKGQGFNAVSCYDGSEAIRYMGVHHREVLAVLLDIYMPEVDGISALGHFRSKYPSIPVIIITGSEDAEDEETVTELGAIAYIQKPFHPTTIGNTVATLLNGLLKKAG